MDLYRPLRTALLCYELIRFAGLVSLPALFAFSGEGGTFPHLAYMAPNGLFLLMSLFIRFRPGDYRVYVPLYAAGKIMGVIAFAGWCVFSLKSLTALILLMRPEQLMVLGGSFWCFAADVLAAAGGLALMNRFNRAELLKPAEGVD